MQLVMMGVVVTHKDTKYSNQVNFTATTVDCQPLVRAKDSQVSISVK